MTTAALAALITATSEAASAQRAYINARKDEALGRCSAAAVARANDVYESKVATMDAAHSASGLA